MSDDSSSPLSLAFAMRIYRMLDAETSDRADHPMGHDCRVCNRRRSWAGEAIRRAKAISDAAVADLRPELARDV